MKATFRMRYDRARGCAVDAATGEPLPPLSSAPLLTGIPNVSPDYPAYFSHGSRTMVEGRAARREDLKRTGSREVDPSEIKDVDRATNEFARSQTELARERNVHFERQEYRRG